MKARCKVAVAEAIGRDLTAVESRKIEDRITDAMRQQAIKDPLLWQSTPKDQQLRIAAQEAAKGIIAEANLKRERLEQSIIAIDNINNHAAEQIANGFDEYKLDALHRHIVEKSDGRNNTSSIESSAIGIYSTAIGRMSESLEAISPKLLGMIADKKNELELRKAMHGEQVADSKIMQAAKKITEELDSLRQRFNAAGGKIGELENRGHAHSWSLEKFVKLGDDAVVNILKDRIDPKMYVHENGKMYSAAEREALLKEFYTTVSTDGANKQLTGGAVGSGVKANSGAHHRVIHFKDGTAATEALSQLSDKNLWQSILGEADQMAKNIAMVEKFGANPDHAVKILLDQYTADSKLKGMDAKKADALAHNIEKYYNHQAGYNSLPVDKTWLADSAQGLRNLQLLRLGFSPITAIGDTATMFRTVAAGGLSRFSAINQLLKGLDITNQTEKRMAMRAGLMFRTVINDMSRISAEDSHNGWTGKLGSAFMRATQLTRLNELQRRAYQIPAMDTIGQLTRDHENIKDIEQGDHKFLLAKGIDQKTWDIWRQAKLDGWDTGDHTVLTPDAIYQIEGASNLDKQKAASKLMSVVMAETDIAVIEPGARTTSLKDGMQKGTWLGEFGRSALTFKTFAAAFLQTHGERGMTGYDTASGKANYFARLVASSWVCGIMANWIQDMLNGKNPRNLNPLNGEHGVQNMIAGLLKGGGLGPYGDFLFGMATQGGNTLTEMTSGPSISSIARLDNIIRGNILKGVTGKDNPMGAAEAIEFGKGFLPTNLWYTKAVFDHMVFQQLQEYFSPGYLQHVKRKAERTMGTSYFVPPGMSGVEAPNLKNAIGEK